MKRIVFFLTLILLPILPSFGQNLVPFGGSNSLDTGYERGSLRIMHLFQLNAYANSDTNRVLGVDANGNVVIRLKGNGSVDSITYVTTTRLDSFLNYYLKLSKYVSDSVIFYNSLADTSIQLRSLIGTKVSETKYALDSVQYYLSLQDTATALRVFIASLPSYGISTTDLTHWNTAYNKYPVSATFNAATGNYTITLNDATTIVTSFDGRYPKYTDTSTFLETRSHAAATYYPASNPNNYVTESKYQTDTPNYVTINGNVTAGAINMGTTSNQDVNIQRNGLRTFHSDAGYTGIIFGGDTLYIGGGSYIGLATSTITSSTGGLQLNYRGIPTTNQFFPLIFYNSYVGGGRTQLKLFGKYTGTGIGNDRTSDFWFANGVTSGIPYRFIISGGGPNTSVNYWTTFDAAGDQRRWSRNANVTIDNRGNPYPYGNLDMIENTGQTGNAINVYGATDTVHPKAYISPYGKGGFSSLSLKNVRTISTNATVNDTDNYVQVNSSVGAVILTLNTSSYTDKHEWRIFKTTSDTNTITLTTTTGTIQGSSSFSLSLPYASATVTFDGTNYWIAGYNNGSVASVYAGSLTASRFGILNDLKHRTFNIKSGNDTVTSNTTKFLPSDVGKLIAIHNFRLKPTYWFDTAINTSKITAYVNDTTIVIDSNSSVTRRSSQGYYYTNNCDAIYTMVSICKNSHVGHVHWDLTDTAGTNWHYSNIGASLSNKYFPLYNLTIQGNSDANLKFCDEDDLPTDSASAYVWGGFIIDTLGGSGIEDINIISPDRSTPNVTKQNITAINAATNLSGELNIKNVNICGDGLGDTLDNPNWRHEWGTGISFNSVAGPHTLDIANSNLYSDFENISYFPTSTNIDALIKLNNVNLYYSGCPEESVPMYGAATILSGSDTVHLSGVSNSWYKYTSEIGLNYHKPLRIVDSVNNDSFTCNMVTILDPHTLIIDVNAPATFTNVTVKPFSGQNMSQGEGHSMYIHPNTSVVFNNVSVYGANLLALQRYSAGSVHNGAYLNIFNHCNSYTYDGISPNGNTTAGTWLLGHQGPYTFYIRDCDSMYYYDYGQPLQVVAWNTHFGNAQNTFSPTIHNNSEFHNCSGGNLTIDNSAKVLVDGGTWANITANKSANGDTLIIKNANVDLLYTLDTSRFAYTATFNTTVKRPQGTYPVYNYTGEYGSLRTTSSSINLTDTDLYVNASAPTAMVTITLPVSATRVNKVYHVTKTSGNYPIKIAPASGLIDSQSAIYLSRPNASVAVRFDGVNYTTISYSKSSDSTTTTGGGSGVTSITAGNGLLGGTITSSGTINIDTTGTSGTKVFTQSAFNTAITSYSKGTLSSSGSIPYYNGTQLTEDNTHLFWDATNKRLGVGTGSPSAPLHVVSGNNTFRFNNGASNVTPNISVGTSGGKSTCLLSGSSGTAFTFDNTGTFNITTDTKANIDGGSTTGGTVLATVFSNGNMAIGSTTDNGIGKLQVNGKITVATTSDATGNFVTKSASTNELQVRTASEVATDIGAITAVSGQTMRLYSGKAATDTVIQTLTDGATITFNLDNGLSASVTLGGNRILLVTNQHQNSVFFLKVIQDATGSRTMTWPANFKWPSGTAPTLTTTAAHYDTITGWYDGTNWLCNYTNDLR